MSTLDQQNDPLAQSVDVWLEGLGLRFDPFRELNAGQDPNLHEYLVAHETFEAIRGDGVSFVFAPAGGGKSAFRVRLARACRVGENGRRLFPIVYLLPETVILAPEAERRQAHLDAILQAAAFELLLRLAYRPSEFTALERPVRQLVRSLLEQRLPGPLFHFLDQLESPDNFPALAQPYDPTARWPKPPSAEMLLEFRDALAKTPPLAREAMPDDGLHTWLELLTGPLGFEAVYLLVDGVDAYPETLRDSEKAIAFLSPLLERADEWAAERLFLKAFLPLALKDAFSPLTARASTGIMEWTFDLLLALIKSRVAAAAETAPAGLDMLCRPDLRNLDRQVIEAVEPLPREVLAFVERIFVEHVRRVGPTGKLAHQDVQAARGWYDQHRPRDGLS
jgi:hypothetical protein